MRKKGASKMRRGIGAKMTGENRIWKKGITLLGAAALMLALAGVLGGCSAGTAKTGNTEPLWTASGQSRTKTIVISDLHLGVDDAYAETVKNRPLLVEFLKRVEKTSDVEELVIAGDFLDEWYLPVSYPAYSDSAAFYQKVIANNKTVIDALNGVMKSGVKLVYVPGNHDMTLEAAVLDKALPGIVQARDVEGLGVYTTGTKGNIAIEHGHRYDAFSAPDTVSNAALTGSDKTILPPGYFYARYAATWVTEGRPSVTKNYPTIDTAPDKADADQYGAYLYYRMLSAEFTRMTPKEGFADKIFNLKIAGFNGSYSVEDLYPVVQADGTISAPVLYKNFQRSWEARQTANKVGVPVSFETSVMGALGYEFAASQAKAQYLENTGKAVDVVVFGHTHIPQYLDLGNGKLYINSGTWVDNNTSDKDGMTRTFAVITKGSSATGALYQYGEDSSVTDVSQKVVR